MTMLFTPLVQERTYVPSPLWRISVARYHEMIEAGTLTENDHLELLEGYLIEKKTVNPPHTFATETIGEAFARLVSERYFVNSQQPITMQDSEPEPDVYIVLGKRRDFVQSHPIPEDIALLVEVSDTTLNQDQTWKKRIYAQAGIPVYWIVNLPDRQIEVYMQPTGPSENPTYLQLTTFREADDIPVILEGVETAVLSVQNLLP